jgi:hypothetical protein
MHVSDVVEKEGYFHAIHEIYITAVLRMNGL